MSPSKTTYSCKIPECGNLVIRCVSHMQSIMQPYAFSSAILNSDHPLSRIATNLSTVEV